MPYTGPWITPHTTRFGGIDPTPPLDYISTFQGDTWADTVNAFGSSTVGPTNSTANSSSPAPAQILTYQVFPLFTRYTAAQALSWHPLSSIDPSAAFPPYTDAAPVSGRTVVGVDYETPHGTMLTSPRIEVVATTGGGNLNLPDAVIDIYQLDAAVIGAPGYRWYDPAGLDTIAANKIGSVDSVGPGVFTGSTVAPTATVVVLLASAAALVDPFPYPTPGASGFQQFPAVGVLVEYLGPRFRFVYAGLPPLRQHPRDDALGGAPRQGHVNQPQSTQASARQGWQNTYR